MRGNEVSTHDLDAMQIVLCNDSVPLENGITLWWNEVNLWQQYIMEVVIFDNFTWHFFLFTSLKIYAKYVLQHEL